MRTVMRNVFYGLLWLAVLMVGIGLGLGFFNPPSAAAAIRQLEESPGQVVYQSRQTLHDQRGQSWQAIAFKRIRPDGSTSVALRLVGFPGAASLERSQPLTLTNALGKTLTAADDSGKIFTDEAAPEPNVGQYDLHDLLPQLQAEIPLQLTLPTIDGQGVRLTVPSALIAEWKTVAGASLTGTAAMAQTPAQTDSGTALDLKAAVERTLAAIPAGYYKIDDVAGLKRLQANAQALLVDVREPAEYQAGHIPEAINIPLRTLTQHLEQISRDRPMVLYCSSGYRSAMGVVMLHLLGYDNVQGFPLSFAGWKAAGESIAK